MPKRQPLQDINLLIGQTLNRAFKIAKGALDEETRTVEMAITSDEPILHWLPERGLAYVILDHNSKSINLERLKTGAAFLDNHDFNRRIGRIRDGVTDGKVLRVKGRFNSRPLGEEIFQEVKEDLEHGDSPGASAWFSIERVAPQPEGYKDGIPIVRATRWTFLEGSVASVEADTRSGIGRAKRAEAPADDEEECDAESADDCETDDCPVHAGRTQPRRRTTMCNARSAEECQNESCQTHAGQRRTPPPPTHAQILQARITEFVETAELFADTEEQKAAFRALARTTALEPAKTVDDLKTAILAARVAAQAQLDTAKPPAAGTVVQFGYVSKPRNFKGEGAAERAYRFAAWALAGPFSQLRNHSMPEATRMALQRAETFAREQGLLTRIGTGQNETLNEAGGYTVPHEFGNDLIDLREEYGVFRANAKIVPMASDSRSDPRRDGGMTAYWEDETDALEASMKTWGRVGLKAKKLTALGKFSREVSEDSMVNFGDDLAGEIAYAFVVKEDGAGFLGDGTKAYGGIRGVCTRLTSLNLASGAAATIAQTSGLKVATGTGSYGGILLADFSRTKSRLPRYAFQRGVPKWYMHQSFFYDVVEPLILASGGITADMIAAGVPLRLAGYEVVPTQVMPSIWAIDQIVALFGVLPLAASLGDRRQATIELSDQVYWTTDEIGIKGTERLDINVHDVGGASATASERAVGAIAGPGPIVGLITAHT